MAVGASDLSAVLTTFLSCSEMLDVISWESKKARTPSSLGSK